MTKRWWPRSLRGQMIAVLLIGLGVAQFLGFSIYRIQYQSNVRSIREESVLARVASIIRLFEITPASTYESIVRTASSPPLRLVITRTPLVEITEESSRALHLRQQLAALIGAAPTTIRIGLRSPEGEEFAVRFLPPERREPAGGEQERYSKEETSEPIPAPSRRQEGRASPQRERRRAWRLHGQVVLTLAVQLDDGRWLNAVSLGRPLDPFWEWSTTLSVGLTAVVLLALMIWMVRRITRPLTQLAVAAEKFGRGETTPPLQEDGPEDIRDTIRAFNCMRARLQRFVQDRTRMLAAISHDLRTPITALRVRAEMIDDEETRGKILASLDEMQAMTEATLAFVREEATQEDTRLIDLEALVESLCDDFSDIGKEVTFQGPGKTPYRCRSLSLKRAIGNLLENAVVYGQRARVSLTEESASLVLSIDDDGPGIADAEMERVFEPFVRLENSRSRETGGVGLGLAIARSIIRRHGGDITLANRPGGGLRVTVHLPKGSMESPSTGRSGQVPLQPGAST